MLLEFADRRINDEDEAQAAFGLPLLAQIPRPSRSVRPASRDRDPLQDEGYANLAASLMFSRNGPHPRSLLVTSPCAGDGKTTVTFGLARALTLLGKSAIIVEADLRHPRAGRPAEFGRGGGLTAILMGRSEIPDELVEVDAVSMRPTRREQPRCGRFVLCPPRRSPRSAAAPFAFHGAGDRGMPLARRLRADRHPAGRPRPRCNHARGFRRRRRSRVSPEVDDQGCRPEGAPCPPSARHAPAGVRRDGQQPTRSVSVRRVRGTNPMGLWFRLCSPGTADDRSRETRY